MTTHSGTTKPLPTSKIEGIQTMIPNTVTHPRSSRRVLVSGHTDTDIYKHRCHIILYYKNAHNDDSGWVFAGGAKESFGKAMEENPIIGGRVYQVEEKLGGNMALEVVSNDCGVRLIEARIAVALLEFLDLKDRDETAEAELVYWKDLDEKNPHFGPLLYVQVTNFLGGGYSIGISCNLLLADPSAITSFLFYWAEVHKKMIDDNTISKVPLHYLPNLKSANAINQIITDPIKSRSKTIIFTTDVKIQNHNTNKELVSICIEEAESELGVKIPIETRMFSVTSFEAIMLEKYLRDPPAPKFKNKLSHVGWDTLGAIEISFCRGNKPVSVSSWIYSPPGEVLAIIFPCSSKGDSPMNIIVSIPNL